MNKKNLIFAGLIIAATAHTASAQSVTLPDRFSYAAKFVCGTSYTPTTNPPQEPVVKRGNYATAVNIHNPWPDTVIVTKQIALSVPERYPDTHFVRPTKRVTDKFPAGSAMYVDCTEIVNLLQKNGTPIPGPFIEGFVVIDAFNPSADSTAVELDVATVTTTAAAGTAAGTVPNSGDVTSHEITIVPGRRLPKGIWPY